MMTNGQPLVPIVAPCLPEGDERELILNLRLGEPAALDRLIARYWSLVAAYAARILEGSDLAEDVAQETFLRLWEHREGCIPADSLRPLLYRIARNLALNERRRSRARTRSVERVGRASVSSAPTPAEVAEEREMRVRVEAAIAGLPARRREIFVLARFHDLSFRDIAEVMGISPQTVANQMTAALTDLQESLRPYLDDPAGIRRARPTRAGKRPARA